MTAITFPALKRPALAALLAAMVLAGCATPEAVDPAALPAVPAGFKEADSGRWTVAAPADMQERGAWWRLFSDPVLDGLAERAALHNTDLQGAAARLAQARALLRVSDAARAPQLQAQAGALREAPPGMGGRAATLLSAGLGLSYEADLVGRLSAATRAATLDAQAREALLQSTRLVVQADVAYTYLTLRALDSERRLVRDTLLAYGDTLRLTERRFEAGDVAELDVARVRTEVAATEAEALALDRQRAELEHALAVLVGEPASSFAVVDLAASGQPLPQVELPHVPPGLPSTVLARRPDVAAAQRSLMAAQERVGIARAAWFPSLALTASGGHASGELSDLFEWSARAWSVGALLSLPIFDGGRREAGVQTARAELDAALAAYRQQVLTAFRDVEDQLSGLRLLAQQSQLQQRAVESAARATALSASRYRNGLVSQLELLDAQRSELRNRRQALVVQAAQYQATVGLIRALGGGWEGPAEGDAPPSRKQASL
ncbi:efflux transporter outer membrane subunit [Aquabacterium sp. A7-Y]|uniref:efflux transporter outer membrane subunit n=1 Tax=Aquabacterium sp. A7-Y TaxID=1349605 RepID=UPI00223CECD7|nr:efflux transporter outer membrane subunit [Aquabacterium sp. A7-Y]MCW7537132.1 efflux transporter outer membrane subunit [Aquabacterium sp. A7-Y]